MIESELAEARARGSVKSIGCGPGTRPRSRPSPLRNNGFAAPRLRLPRPGRRTLDVDTVLIDRIVPWFDLIVGALLIVGLFTRLAALAGAGFCSRSS